MVSTVYDQTQGMKERQLTNEEWGSMKDTKWGGKEQPAPEGYQEPSPQGEVSVGGPESSPEQSSQAVSPVVAEEGGVPAESPSEAPEMPYSVDEGDDGMMYDVEETTPQPKPVGKTKSEGALASYSIANIDDNVEMPPEELYGTIVGEIDTLGESPRLENIKNVLGEKYFTMQRKAAKGIIDDPELDEDQKVAALQDIGKEIEHGVNMTQMAVDVAAAKSSDQSAAMDALEEQYRTSDQVRTRVLKFMSEEAPDFSGGFWSATKEVFRGAYNLGTSMVPILDNTKVYRIADGVAKFDKELGEKLGKKETSSLFAGELIEHINTTREKMSPKERVTYDEKLLGVFESLRSDGVMNDASLYEDLYFFTKTFSHYLGTDEYSELERWFDDAAYSMDEVALPIVIASALSKAANGSRMVKNASDLRNVYDASPEEARRIHAKALASGDEEMLQELAGFNIDEHLEGLLTPSTTKEQSEMGISSFDLTETYNNPSIFTVAEKDQIASKMIDNTNRQRLSGAVIQEGNTVFSETKEGLPIVTSYYGRDKGVGYASVQDAKEHVEELFGEGANISYMRETKDGMAEVENPDHVGPVFARVNQTHFYDEAADSLLDEPGKLGTTNRRAFGRSVRTMDELMPAGEGSAREIGGLAQLQTSAVRDQLIRPFAEAVDKLGKVGVGKGRSIKKLDNVLREISEKDISPSEVKMKYNLSNKEYDAFLQFRKAQDDMYILNNLKRYNRLKTKGAQTVEYAGDEVPATPVKLEDFPDNRSDVFIVDGDKVTRTSVKKARELAEADPNLNWWVTQAKSQNLPGNAVVAFRGSAGAKFKPLSPSQLNYKKNYYTKIYDANYIIRARNTKTGEDLGAIDGATTLGQAKSIRDELASTSNSVDVEFDWIRAREVSQSDMDEMVSAGSDNHGLFFSSRGEGLKSAEVQNPIEAMFSASEMISRRVGIQQAINRDINRFANTFGEMATVREGGKAVKLKDISEFSGDVKTLPSEQMLKEANWESSQAKNDALIYYNDLAKRSGTLEAASRKKFAGTMLDIAESFAEKGLIGKWGEKLFTSAAKTRPVSAVRKYNFITMLALNPARMALVQSMQPMFLAGIAGRDLPGGIKDGQLLMASYVRKQFANKDYMPKDPETRELFDSLYKSGIMQNVSQHSFGRQATKARSQKKGSSAVLDRATALPRGLIEASRTIGFDFGELQNQAITYAMAARRYKRENPGADITKREHRDKIAATTREWSLNMDQRGEAGYANGMWSVPLQFMSIQHKSLMAWMPSYFGGNPNFTLKQKMGLFGAQLSLYGTQGVGIDQLTDRIAASWGVEHGDEAYVGLKGGLVDFMFHQALDEDLNISGSLAPGGSSFQTAATNFMDIVTTGKDFEIPLNLRTLSSALGPTGASGSKILGLLQAGDLMLSSNRSVEDITDEQWKILRQRVGMTFSSGISNYMKYKVAMHMGYNYSLNTGRGMTDSSEAAAIAKAFGITTHEESAFYDNISAMYEKESMSYSPKGATKDGAQAAKLWRAMVVQGLVNKGVAIESKDGKTIDFADMIPEDGSNNYKQAMAVEDATYREVVDAMNVVGVLTAGMDKDQMLAFEESFAKELMKGAGGGFHKIFDMAIGKQLDADNTGDARHFFHLARKICASSGNSDKCKADIENAEKNLETFESNMKAEENE